MLERADRHPDRYRGPSPLLVFGAYFFAMSLIGLLLLSVLGVDPDQPFSFLGIGVQGAAADVFFDNRTLLFESVVQKIGRA